MTGLAAPQYFAIHHKEQSYIAKPDAGRHRLQRSIPLMLVLKKLGFSGTANEARKTIQSGSVLVNSKVVKAPKYPVGLNDIVELKGAGKSYTVGINQYAKADLVETAKPDYDAMLFKVVGKYKAKANQTMIRLHDGRITKAPKEVNVNDSVLIDSKGSVKKVLPMKVGSNCLVIDGVHVSASGKIKELKSGTMHTSASALVVPEKGDGFETTIQNIMVTA